MNVSEILDHRHASLRLPQRYGRIIAVATPNQAAANTAQSAEEATRFFARRGVPIEAGPLPEGKISLAGKLDPSHHGHFRDLLHQWSEETDSVVAQCVEEDAGADDATGFEHACPREDRCQAQLDRICRDLGFPVVSGEGGRWAQAVGGSPEHIRPLAEAFANLRQNGRISRFPKRAITVARQGTCSPYGLPAVLLKLKGTCRVFSERVGLRLLECTPRVISVTEVAPAVILVENTPPLDNIWDEARFWSSWQSLAQDAWDFIDAWAAVRVLRYVETDEREWKFYNHTHSPVNVVERAAELPDTPQTTALEPSTVTASWLRRRCCEIALALQLGAGSDAGLRRHIIGHLATPYPFLQPPGSSAGTIAAVEQYLAKAASALHWELLSEENRGCDVELRVQRRELAARACVGLRSLLTDLICLNVPFLESAWEAPAPVAGFATANAGCCTTSDLAAV